MNELFDSFLYFWNSGGSIGLPSSSSHVWMWELDYKENWALKILLICGVGEDSWESLGLQGDPTSPFWRRSALGVHWKDWCWSWNSNTLSTWCKELTHLKRLWCRERLGAGGQGEDRGWDGWMALLTQWTWVWVNSGSWWWTGRPGVLHGVAKSRTWLSNWTELQGFPGGSVAKSPPAIAGDARDLCLIPGLGRSPGEGNGNTLQYSCLENPMDRGVWQATAHGITKESNTTEHSLAHGK